VSGEHFVFAREFGEHFVFACEFGEHFVFACEFGWRRTRVKGAVA
jgi:hypothetical protein